MEELHEKLQEHPETKLAGFVVDENPNLKPEIKKRIEELEQNHNGQRDLGHAETR